MSRDLRFYKKVSYYGAMTAEKKNFLSTKNKIIAGAGLVVLAASAVAINRLMEIPSPVEVCQQLYLDYGNVALAHAQIRALCNQVLPIQNIPKLPWQHLPIPSWEITKFTAAFKEAQQWQEKVDTTLNAAKCAGLFVISLATLWGINKVYMFRRSRRVEAKKQKMAIHKKTADETAALYDQGIKDKQKRVKARGEEIKHREEMVAKVMAFMHADENRARLILRAANAYSERPLELTYVDYIILRPYFEQYKNLGPTGFLEKHYKTIQAMETMAEAQQ